MTPLTRWRLHIAGMAVMWVFVGGMFVLLMLLGGLFFFVAVGRQSYADADDWRPLLVVCPIALVVGVASMWWTIRRVLRERRRSVDEARARIAEDDARAAHRDAPEAGTSA